jgi:hypothetical protein
MARVRHAPLEQAHQAQAARVATVPLDHSALLVQPVHHASLDSALVLAQARVSPVALEQPHQAQAECVPTAPLDKALFLANNAYPVALGHIL